jgi:hypothetical protein
MTRDEFWVKHDAINKLQLPRDIESAAHVDLHHEYWGAYVDAFSVKCPAYIEKAARKGIADGVADNWALNKLTSIKWFDDAQMVTRGNSALMAALRANGEYWSLSVNTCLLKRALFKQLGDAFKPSPDYRETLKRLESVSVER